MTFGEAMTVINKYGAKRWCNSLVETIIEMEESMPYLTREQQLAFAVIVGEWESEDVA
jgi:hypothetical protein